MQHDEAIAVAQRILHIVRNHQRRQLILRDDLLCQFQHLRRRLRVKGCRMLIEEEQIRLDERRHEKCQCLPLSAREKPDTRGKAILQTEFQTRELLTEHIAHLTRRAPFECRRLAAPRRDGEIFLDHHACRRPHHRILENASDELCTAVLRPLRNVLARNVDLPRIDRNRTRDSVHQRGLACTVAADHGDEITGAKVKADARERLFLRNRPGVKCFLNILDLQHHSAPFRIAWYFS